MSTDDATTDPATVTFDPAQCDSWGDEGLAQEAVVLARELLRAALADETSGERRRRLRLGRLLADRDGRELVLALTDEVLRIDDRRRAAKQFDTIVRGRDVGALGRLDRAMLRVGARLATALPSVVMPLVVRRIRSETRGVVLPADDPALAGHIARRAAAGFDLNVNPLGEAILSDAEADHRFEAVCRTIARPDVDYVSVKISSIVANLDVLAFDHSADRVAERLRVLYRAADAATPRTFVNLDMEEYRDLELTLVAFMAVLDEDEFRATDAGIVLQAYLPDSHAAAERLGSWAVERRRREDGRGGCIKVRVVKGANLAMELVDAEQHGWVAAPYGSKADVDASYKALLDSLLRPEWSSAVRVGVASHNLFDVAWALTIGRDRNAGDRMDFEMLEGMAPAQSRAVRASTDSLRMYSPVVAADDFSASIAYLARRLDENTQPDNFLRALFTLQPDTPEFDAEAERFRASVAQRHRISTSRRRTALPAEPSEPFVNDAETDFTDGGARASVAHSMNRVDPPIAPVIDDAAIVGEMVARAAAVADGHSVETRIGWLHSMAATMRAARFDTLAVMAKETGKTALEGDREVSEAIDFCEYYAHEASRLASLATEGFGVRGRGVVAVIGPWNFPYAIPAGGVAAALVAGNGVVLKPAPEAVGVGTLLAEQFWAAGVPRDVLQLLVCDDGPVGRALVVDPRVDTVVLTGSFATAAMFREWRPELRLLAETSGKNALVITAAADVDEAIADLVRSAFGHAGQKCSAASLAIVEASIYDSADFLPRLRDAARSLRVGPATDPATMMGPVIAPPTGALQRALTELDHGETWLVEPRLLDTDGDLAGRLWSPGVRIGVAPGSWFHRTECFGPVLGVMRVDDLDHAIAVQNDSDFGLTGGLHSLDDVEIARWLDRVEVGNAYVNRGITGAIVRRQPFGGWKQSSVGGGCKAGGPGYVPQFASITDRRPGGAGPDGVVDPTAHAAVAYRRAWAEVFAVEHDPSGLRAESNILRYRSLRTVLVRYDAGGAGSDGSELALVRAAARVAGVSLIESEVGAESDEALIERLGSLADVDRVRLLAPMSDAARRCCHEANIAIDDSPPVADGFVEMYRWVREQSVSRSKHRHGRLTA
jgi:RHH-type transcriptional regulator, proline utilization regulon repressor / proline dehydrogenase / delta 1-pyrroline-5-carboxylate dehydrogenase